MNFGKRGTPSINALSLVAIVGKFTTPASNRSSAIVPTERIAAATLVRDRRELQRADLGRQARTAEAECNRPRQINPWRIGGARSAVANRSSKSIASPACLTTIGAASASPVSAFVGIPYKQQGAFVRDLSRNLR